MSTHIHPPLGRATAPAVRPVDRLASLSKRRAGWTDRWVARRVQQTIAPAGVRLELWDRSSPYDSDRPPVGDLVVHDRRTLVGLAVARTSLARRHGGPARRPRPLEPVVGSRV
jgi:hypothetical protein